MSDTVPTPETNNEVNRGIACGDSAQGCLLSMTTLARKLERERDEARRERDEAKSLVWFSRYHKAAAELATLRDCVSKDTTWLKITRATLDSLETEACKNAQVRAAQILRAAIALVDAEIAKEGK